MKCYRCSTKNPDGAVCCRYCGAPFIQESPIAESESNEGLLPPQEAYFEENQPKKISFFTQYAYRILSSRRRYLLAFGLLAVFALCFILLVLLLCQIGGDAIKTFELTGMLSSTRDASIIGQAQQAWKLLWSYVVVIALCGAGIFFCVTIAYKMIKILLIFRERKRAIVPIDWEKIKKKA